MTDGQSIFGVDTARYQPFGTYDPGAFSIVNFEDPQLEQKLRARAAAGIPWGVYLWIYPGHDCNIDAQHMVDVVRALGLGDPPAGYWADYEDAGIVTEQLANYFAGLDTKDAAGGYYSGPHALDHGPFLERSWWNAAYPTGDVAFPGYASLWASSRPRPMHLWQYTSAGGLDRDVVVDEPWWADLTHHAPTPDPEPIPAPEESPKMEVVVFPGPFGPIARLVTGDGVILDEWKGGDVVNGIPVAAANERPTGTPIRIIKADQVDQAAKFKTWSDAATKRVLG